MYVLKNFETGRDWAWQGGLRPALAVEGVVHNAGHFPDIQPAAEEFIDPSACFGGIVDDVPVVDIKDIKGGSGV